MSTLNPQEAAHLADRSQADRLFPTLTTAQIDRIAPHGRIEDNSAIVVRTRTEVVTLQGDNHLERVQWRDHRTGDVEAHDIRHVFMMTGADPNTRWLDGCIALDGKGFVKTGADLTLDDLAAAKWPLSRAPYLLETSRPGVFAVGDVRGGNVKRVASAVGEGSIAIALVHQILQQ